MSADRDLLFGLLALQNGLIDQGQLMLAFQAWTRDKAKSLADQFVARGDLDAEQRAGVEAMVALHVKKHGNAEKSLAAVPANRSTRASLAALGEPEIEATIARVTRSKDRHATEADGDHDAERTACLSVGEPTSDSQRFRLLRPHARGGLGEVFVALDVELHREVALKQILEKHADDPVSRQRFLAEAEITGGLEHPGVVPVYGLGTYGGGRPYYAMRFIRGDSLKEAIDCFHADEGLKGDHGRRSLELRKLLRRFTDVCNAIEYAHSRGVLHRDIKPANIVLGRHGETLVVDWGLAKAVGRADPSVGEQTIAPSSSGSSETQPGSALGTPAYMSPEQARGDLEALGPRSDVYSLGATLYCLLTGKPPLEGDDVGEVLRRVQRAAFMPPRRLDPSIDRALEAVCLKAMATEPENRHPSCRALAEDIERWMADEPVAAWREPWARTLVRWLTRHRSGVTGIAAAGLAALVGLAAVLAVQTRANAELSRERAAVQARYELAMDAIRAFHTGVSEDFLLKQDQFKELRDRLLKSAQDFYGKLGALLERDTDPASRRALAASNFELAELTTNVGRAEDALAAHRAALAAREALAAGPGAGAAAAVDVGRSLTAVAGLLRQTGKNDEALATFRRAEAVLSGAAASDPAARAALAESRTRMGQLLFIMGRFDEALTCYGQARAEQEALAAAASGPAEARRELGETIRRIGDLLSGTGRPREAEAEYRQAIEVFGELAAENPAVADFRRRLAIGRNNLGRLLSETGRPREAEREYRQAIETLVELATENPAVAGFRILLAHSRLNLGNLLSETGRPREAEAEYRQAIALYGALAAENPAVTDFRTSLAAGRNTFGWILSQAGDPVGAESEYLKARALYQELADANPGVTGYRDQVANLDNNLSAALRRLGRTGEALERAERAVAAREALVREDPWTPAYRGGLAENYLNRGLARRDAGDPVGAVADLRRAVATYGALPSLTGEQTFLSACAHAALSSPAGRDGSGISVAEAAFEAKKAVALLRKAVGVGYRNPDAYRTEDALDPLRDLPDFKLLIMDLALPDDPFASSG
jgi:serine/threonine-protein kinase